MKEAKQKALATLASVAARLRSCCFTIFFDFENMNYLTKSIDNNDTQGNE